MNGIPLIRAVIVGPILCFLDGLGAPVDRLLGRATLRRDALQDPEALVPLARVMQFQEEAARAEGIEDLGLRAMQGMSPTALGAFGRRIARAVTLGDALLTAHRLFPFYSSGEQAWLTRPGDEVRVCQRFVLSGADAYRQSQGTDVILHLNLLRAVMGPGWQPTRVGLSAPETRVWKRLAILAGTPVEFGQPFNSITFPAACLARPLRRPTVDRAAQDDGGWEGSGPAKDFAASLRQVVTTLLPTGYPDIHLLAESAGLSVRTLQRRLGEEGLTYGRLVAQARFELACRRLEDPSCRLIDVAFDLGYSDPAHFSRAFRSWSAMTPREFRRARRNGGAS